MVKIKERRLALKLRLQGKSYSQIKKILSLSKSTLSLWLKDYPLTKAQIDLLRGKSPQRIERFRMTMQRKREQRHRRYYKEEKNKLLPFSKRELFIAGLFLYWGEGSKSQRNSISFNNTDPMVVKFMLYWLIKGLGFSKKNIKVFVHLYDDMDIKKEIEFWSDELRMNMSNFSRPYIKKSKRIELDHKGFGHGTCGIRINNTEYQERILMAIKAIGDFYSEKIKGF